MDAHKVMGHNITYENLKDIADGNGKTLEAIRATADKDRPEHPAEYSAATS